MMNTWTFIRDAMEWKLHCDRCSNSNRRKGRHDVINGRLDNTPAGFPLMVYTNWLERNDGPDFIQHYLIYPDEVGPLMDHYISDILEKEVLDGE